MLLLRISPSSTTLFSIAYILQLLPIQIQAKGSPKPYLITRALTILLKNGDGQQ